jgi:aspartyl-tRNA(Asn)/glutamyl-tRNA(Gln) amidotransferase subunit A
MPDPVFLPIAQQTRLIDQGALDPVALTRRYLERAETVGKPLNSVVTLCRETALAAAEASAARARARRRLGPLDGIAVALKDNIDLAGVPTSNGFGGALPWRVPTEDAEVVRRLRAAGAVILGKLNMHEGALGATNDNPHLGRATNPHRAGFTPGGSSGGSGIAVAAYLCAAALGTDTGGSVRLPASYCGVVGLKPSYGLVSTRGVVPLSYTLDHVGPLARSVADAALMLDALAGFDPDCAESRRLKMPSPITLAGSLAGLRVGVIRNFDDESPEPAVVAAFDAACRQVVALGAAIETLALPSYDMARGRRAGFVRVEVEAAFVHGALYQREPARFSPAMAGYLEFGARATAQQVLLADRRIALGAYELAGCFDRVDAILSPTAPQAAFAFDQKTPDNQSGFTILANFAGCPAISLPMGKTDDGLPLGLQVMAPVGHEDRVLRIAAEYEAAAAWQLAPPRPYGAA